MRLGKTFLSVGGEITPENRRFSLNIACGGHELPIDIVWRKQCMAGHRRISITNTRKYRQIRGFRESGR